MMKTSEFAGYLRTLFTGVSIYNGSIDKTKPQCIGVYARGNGGPTMALGGIANSSYTVKQISLLVHWTEDADACETQAIAVYDALVGKSDFLIGTRRIVSLQMLDDGPIDVDRDANNIAEMVIRLNIISER
jgi:kynureninase